MTIKARDLIRLIDHYGQTLTLKQWNQGAQYDPSTGRALPTYQNVEVTGYVASYDLAEVDGVSVLRGDRKVLFGPLDNDQLPFEPQVDDIIAGEGADVTIVSVSKIMSNGLTLCHVCQVRK